MQNLQSFKPNIVTCSHHQNLVVMLLQHQLLRMKTSLAIKSERSKSFFASA